MAVAPNTGMKKADMRKLLTRSKEEPVTCAIGQNALGALMVLDKRKPGRALETGLKAEFPDAWNTRFGTAFVDAEDNPKLVKLTLNKPVSGMAKRLIKTLKGTGFNKVVILSEDGAMMDQFEEEDDAPPVDEDGAAPSPIPAPPEAPPPAVESAENKAARAEGLIARLKELSAQIPAASHGDATRLESFAKLARMAAVQIKTGSLDYGTTSIEQLEAALAAAPPAPPPPPAPPSPGDTAGRIVALTGQLKTLVPQIAASAGGDAARLATLSKLAKDANVEIKTGNLDYAAGTIERLRMALGAVERVETPADAAADQGTNAIPASRIVWTNVRREIAAEVEKLRVALAAAYGGQSFAAEIEQRFQGRVTPMLDRFDDRLDGALDDLAAAAAEQRATYAADARGYVRDYRAFAETDPFIEALDSNPFVPVEIRSRTTAALARVEQALDQVA